MGTIFETRCAITDIGWHRCVAWAKNSGLLAGTHHGPMMEPDNLRAVLMVVLV